MEDAMWDAQLRLENLTLDLGGVERVLYVGDLVAIPIDGTFAETYRVIGFSNGTVDVLKKMPSGELYFRSIPKDKFVEMQLALSEH